MKKVAIVGAGTLPWKSRYTDKTARALALEAVKGALADAKLTKDDISSVVYSVYCDMALMQQHSTAIFQDYLGLGGKPSLRITGGADTGTYAINAAFSQVASGLSDVLLLVAVQKGSEWYRFDTRSRGDGLLKGFSISSDTIWLNEIIAGVPPYLNLVFWLPNLQKYGSPTPEQVAKVSVKDHRNALANPEAQLKLDLTVEDVLNSRIIAHPTTMYECCLYSDCAAALILASEDRAKEICDDPVWISGLAVSTAGQKFLPETYGRMMGVHTAAKKAFEMAGIRQPAQELDVLEVYDLITALEVLACEEMGICEPGQAGRLVDEGVFEKTGRLPVNPSGGRTACGHVAAVSSIYSAAQVFRQLQERAVGTQVAIRHGKGVVEAVDGFACFSGVVVLERS